MQFEKEIEDKRGKIIFFSHDTMKINLIETKKGFARGGHFHKYEQDHMLIYGQVEVKFYDIANKQETTKKFEAPSIIHISKNIAHLFIALEDTVFIETSNEEYEITNFPEYRRIVEEKMKNLD